MYGLLILTGKVVISATTKEVAIIAGSYLANKYLTTKKKKADKNAFPVKL